MLSKPVVGLAQSPYNPEFVITLTDFDVITVNTKSFQQTSSNMTLQFLKMKGKASLKFTKFTILALAGCLMLSVVSAQPESCQLQGDERSVAFSLFIFSLGPNILLTLHKIIGGASARTVKNTWTPPILLLQQCLPRAIIFSRLIATDHLPWQSQQKGTVGLDILIASSVIKSYGVLKPTEIKFRSHLAWYHNQSKNVGIRNVVAVPMVLYQTKM